MQGKRPTETYAVTAGTFSKVEEVLKTMHARMTAVFLTPATSA